MSFSFGFSDFQKPNRKPYKPLEHTTEGIWCPCDPVWLSDCMWCGGEGIRLLGSTCTNCNGEGMVVASKPECVDRVVHRHILESPYGSNGG